MSKSLINYIVSVEEKENEEFAAEVEASVEEVEGAQQDLEDLEKIDSGLECLYEVLSSSLESEGLSESELKLVRLTVASYSDMLGVESSQLVSLEAFDESDNIKQSTTVALESIGGTIKKIWEAIKTTFYRIWTSIRDFFNKIFNGTKKIKDNLIKLRVALKKVKKLAPGKVTARGANYLQYDGSVKPNKIIEGLKNTDKAGSIITGSFVDTVTAYYDAFIKGVLKDPKFKAIENWELVDEKMRTVGNPLTLWMINNKNIPIISGDKKINVKFHSFFGETTLDNRKSIIEQVNTPLGTIEVEKPTLRELEDMVNEAIQILTYFDKRKDAIERLTKLEKESIENYDNFLKEYSKGLLGDMWTDIRVKEVMNTANSKLLNVIYSYTNNAFRTAIAVGDFVNTTIKDSTSSSDSSDSNNNVFPFPVDLTNFYKK